MKQRIICFLVMFGLCIVFCEKIYAEEKVNTIIGSELAKFDLEEIDSAMEETDWNFSFKDTVIEAADKGIKISPKEIFSKVIKQFFTEFINQISLIKKIIFIAILCGFLKTLEDSFGSKEVAELGFYVCYILLIYIVMTSFYENSKMVSKTIDSLIIMLKQMIPLFLTITAFSGQAAQAAVMGPFIMSAAGILSFVINSVFVPAIKLTAMLQIANNISEKGILNNLSEFFKNIISIGLKVCVFLFMSIAALQKTGAAGISGILGKTAKSAVGAVPVVGDIMTGAVETAASLTGLLRSSVAIGTVVAVCVVVMTPVIKLLVIFFIYKFTAAVIEPVSEPRLIDALNGAGDFSALLMGAIFVVSSMFVFSAIILLTVI